LPILPGPPLAFVGLWIQQAKTQPPFETPFLWLWAGITIVISALDYWMPVYSTKKFGGSNYGLWGCTLGLIAGLWMGPIGIVLGPFVGAFIGEILANQNSERAFKAALGSFVGFLFSTLMKLIACAIMIWYWVTSW